MRTMNENPEQKLSKSTNNASNVEDFRLRTCRTKITTEMMTLIRERRLATDLVVEEVTYAMDGEIVAMILS